MILILIAIPADANFLNGYALNGSVLVGYVLKIRIGGICIGGIRLRFLLMHTFWMDTHWMDTHSMDTNWWDTCWTDTYWWDTYWWDTYCKTCWCKRFEWIRIAWIRTGGIRVERIRIGGIRIGGIRIGGIRFEWICVGYVWCDGYVWCEICVGYVWCEIRQQSSEEPCDETSFGKKLSITTTTAFWSWLKNTEKKNAHAKNNRPGSDESHKGCSSAAFTPQPGQRTAQVHPHNSERNGKRRRPTFSRDRSLQQIPPRVIRVTTKKTAGEFGSCASYIHGCVWSGCQSRHPVTLVVERSWHLIEQQNQSLLMMQMPREDEASSSALQRIQITAKCLGKPWEEEKCWRKKKHVTLLIQNTICWVLQAAWRSSITRVI